MWRTFSALVASVAELLVDMRALGVETGPLARFQRSSGGLLPLQIAILLRRQPVVVSSPIHFSKTEAATYGPPYTFRRRAERRRRKAAHTGNELRLQQDNGRVAKKAARRKIGTIVHDCDAASSRH